MRTVMTQQQQDKVSAALRHVRDAEYLVSPKAEHKSVDQAFHLAGFGPECIRKAALAWRIFDKPLGHNLGGGSEAVLQLAIDLEPLAGRYGLTDWEHTYPALRRWYVESRYDPTGTTNHSDATTMVDQARAAVMHVVVEMWLDGILPSGALQ